MSGPVGIPRVIMIVQMPIDFAQSLWKNVSITTALPKPTAGDMKNATSALQAAIAAYDWLLAQPTLHTRLQIMESKSVGRRPYLPDKGLQKSTGAAPRMTICSEVR